MKKLLLKYVAIRLIFVILLATVIQAADLPSNLENLGLTEQEGLGYYKINGQDDKYYLLDNGALFQDTGGDPQILPPGADYTDDNNWVNYKESDNLNVEGDVIKRTFDSGNEYPGTYQMMPNGDLIYTKADQSRQVLPKAHAAHLADGQGDGAWTPITNDYTYNNGIIEYQGSSWVVIDQNSDTYEIWDPATDKTKEIYKYEVLGLPQNTYETIDDQSIDTVTYSFGGDAYAQGAAQTIPSDIYSPNNMYYIRNDLTGVLTIFVPTNDAQEETFQKSAVLLPIPLNENIPTDFLKTRAEGGYSITVEGDNLVFTPPTPNGAFTNIEVLHADGAYETRTLHTDSGNFIKLIINPDGTKTTSSNEYSELFYSEKWKINNNGELEYDGQEIAKYDAATKTATFAEGGSIREVQTSTDPIYLKTDASGGVTISQDGKEDILFTAEEAKSIIGDITSTSADTYLENLPLLLEIAKQNGIKRDELIKKDDTLTSGDITISIIEDVNGQVFITYKTGNDEIYELVQYNALGLPTQTEFKTEEGTTTINWEYTGENLVKIISEGTEYTYIQDGNIDLFCIGAKSACVNLVDGSTYALANGEYVDCESQACQDLEEELDAHIEKYRVANGGPTNRQVLANRIFSTLEYAQTGFGKLFSLFMDDDDLADWQSDVDEFFCDTVIGGGIDCWTSLVCDEYTGIQGDGTLIIEGPGGSLEATAHIEAERWDLFLVDDDTVESEFLYKISFGIKNPDNYDKDIWFNVRIKGEREIWLYNEDIELEEGETFSRAGDKILVEYSSTRYDSICLVFRTPIRSNGEEFGELCNDIIPVVSDGPLPEAFGDIII